MLMPILEEEATIYVCIACKQWHVVAMLIHGSCGSGVVRLPPKQLLSNSVGIHVVTYTGWKLRKV